MAPRLCWKDDLGQQTIRTIVAKVIPEWKDGLRPVQMDLVSAILDGDDVLCCTATGDGKSAAFSVPILVLKECNANPTLYPAGLRTRVDPVGVVVTPTKGLASNIVLELGKLHIAGFAYCRESLADARQSGTNLTDAIKSCSQWQVVCVDPEHLRDKEWRTISEWPNFRAKLLFSATDEAHLINEWGEEFRPDFRLIGQFFRGQFPTSTSVVALSATLAPGAATSAVCTSLGLFEGAFHHIRRSNERPNIQFIMQTLTHGLTGYKFPDLLPFLNSGRKTVIHCATLDLVFRVYVYIWRLQPPTADKFRRMYTSLCPPSYNEETIRLIDTDPLCQIVIATIAFSNGINAKKLLDSVSMGMSKSVDNEWQQKGRVGREAGSIARGVILVQPSSITAARKQLNALAKHRKGTTKKAQPPMEHARALLLVEQTSYYAFFNKHYGNPPLETTSLDCIAANRLLPCSICLPRSGKTLTFDAPPSAIVLPPLHPLISAVASHHSHKKLKLTKKEKKLARSALKTFRNSLCVKEQFAGQFRHHPPCLFLPPSIQDAIVDQLLSLSSSVMLHPLLDQWHHQNTHTASLFHVITQLQTKITKKREEARNTRNQKAREKRQADKRKAVSESESKDRYEPESDADVIDREAELDSHLDQAHIFDSFEFPTPADLVLNRRSRPKKRQALDTVTNTGPRRTRTAPQKMAEIAKDYGPQYRPRTRG
ncbi:P-loop containing nucleoside triphosphate hydrolase protein [Mycena galopus ATCC 62051]|nr:P-loop containing nucleoside triphosphate hydrolase protein [Mycena galopus ATCC 62051]